MEDISFEKPKPGTAAVYYDKNTNPPKVLFIQTADGERYIPAPKKGDQSKPFNPTEDALPDTLGRLDFGYTGTEKNNRQLQTLLKAAQQAVLKKYSEQVAFEKLMDSTSKSAKETHAPTEEDGEAPQEVKKTGPIKGYKIHQYHFLHAEDDDNEPAPNLGSRAVSGISAAASSTGRAIAGALGFNKQQKQYKIQSSRLSAPLEQLKNEKPDLFSHAASTSTAQSANDAPPASSSSVSREIEIQDGEHSAVDALSHEEPAKKAPGLFSRFISLFSHQKEITNTDETDESIAKLLESTERELEIPDNSSRAQSKAATSTKPTTAAAPATSSVTNNNNAKQPQEAEFEPLEEEEETEKNNRQREPRSEPQPLSSGDELDDLFAPGSGGKRRTAKALVAKTDQRALIIQYEKTSADLNPLALNAQLLGFNFIFADEDEPNIITGGFENFFIQINLAKNTIRIEGPEITTKENKQQETAILTNVIAACKNLHVKPKHLHIEGRGNRQHNQDLLSTFHSVKKSEAPGLLDQATAIAKKIGAGIVGAGAGAIGAVAKLPALFGKKPAEPIAPPIQQQPNAAPIVNNDNNAASQPAATKTTAWQKIINLLPELPKFEKSESKDPGNTIFQLAIYFEKGLTASEIRSLLDRADKTGLNNELRGTTGFELKSIGSHYYFEHTKNKSLISLTKAEKEFAWTTTEKYGDDNEYIDKALTAMLTLYVTITPTEKLGKIEVETVHGNEDRHFDFITRQDANGDEVVERRPKGGIGRAIIELEDAANEEAQIKYTQLKRTIQADKKITEATAQPDPLKDAGVVLFSEILERESVYQYIQETLGKNPNAFDFDYGDFKFTPDENDRAIFHLTSTEGVDIQIDFRKHIITTNELNNSADYRAACRGIMFLHDRFGLPGEMPGLKNFDALTNEQQKAAHKIRGKETDKYFNAVVYFNNERTRIEYVYHNKKWYENKMEEKKYKGIEFIDLKERANKPDNLQDFLSQSFHLKQNADLRNTALEAANRNTLLLGTRAETRKGSVAGVQENREQIEKAQENRGTKFILCGNEHEGYYLMNTQNGHKITADADGKLQSDFYYGHTQDLDALIQALVNNHIAELTYYQSLPENEMEGKTVTLETTIPAQKHSAKAKEDYKRIAEEVAKRTQDVIDKNFPRLNFTVTCKKEPVKVGFSDGKITQELPKIISPLVPKGTTEDKSASITFGPGPQRG